MTARSELTDAAGGGRPQFQKLRLLWIQTLTYNHVWLSIVNAKPTSPLSRYMRITLLFTGLCVGWFSNLMFTVGDDVELTAEQSFGTLPCAS